ncbi:substrate-binding domain-containing protein [Olivibacter ginsenosidimutans]|uniref:histidine kinase n=2 Tax=Olivibacter ginsenosidimutans TaxID=1176537 RepID=A0ABP9C9U5_9SPHI
MLKEMKRELSFHPEIDFLYADARGDNNRQFAQVQAFLKKKIDLLIISPNEADPLTPIVDQAFQQGIPVIVTDRKTSSGLYNAYVGSDNYNIGYLAGQYLAHHLQGKGKVALITGLPGSSASIEREKGVKEALQHHPNIAIQVQLNGQWLIQVATDEVQQHLRQLQEVDAIFAFNDQMAIGAYQALQQNHAKKPIKIFGVDALPGAGNGLEQIAQGHINASVLYPTGGAEAIRTAVAILHKQPYQRDNLLNTLVIDSANVQLMKMQADKIDSQQQDIDKQQRLLNEQQKIYRNQQSALNILVISLVLAIIFAGIAIYSLKSNWEKNKHLEEQNAEIRKQQQQLIDMSEQVKEVSAAKTNFFTNISHEFKTPLTLILAPVEDLLKEPSLPPAHKEHLLRIKRNGLRLMNLVSELIDIQRLAQEKLKLRAAAQPFQRFINQIVQSFKPLAHQKHILLSVEHHTTISNLWFDADLMEKVLYNLLSNAFKFTPNNGRIQVKTEQNTFGDHVLIRIIDNGKGIHKNHVEHIFDPFYQGAAYSTGGSGLGLALVKEIVELHHGQITVSSKENEGSSFTLRLPVGDAHLTDAEKEMAIEEIADLPKASPDLTTLQTPHDLGMEEWEHLPPKTNTLLVIDDNEEINYFFRDKLSEYYQVYTSTNAEDGIKLAYTKVPDLIISDVVMPGKSGIDLVKLLKKDTRTATIPIILLTALDSEDQRAAGLQAMADAYITKPFSTTHLEAVIQNLIASRKELKQRYSSELSATVDHTNAFSELDRRFLNDLSAIVETHLANPQLNVDDICRQIGISRVQLYRKVKALLHCSVNDYIIHRRLKKSKYLLQQDMTINEVAYQTGFSSPTYFATLFKQKFGLSPSSFKKQLHHKS